MLEYDTETGKARFLDYADVSTNRLEAYVNPQDKIFYEKFNSEGVIEYWVMDWTTYETRKIAQLPDGIKAGRNVVVTNDGNYMSVIGLPIDKVYKILREMEYEILQSDK